eukprot:TRINITY_DN8609_c0_g1_i1.p1 TRINITY_DN8609_c0_g1~~TRINITY_DN8609_c0_g1_i1.p1  ORF type:complete len:139 (+),score=17.28 TRINITY_DN8609_c0_g1_i1:66-482(+)
MTDPHFRRVDIKSKGLVVGDEGILYLPHETDPLSWWCWCGGMRKSYSSVASKPSLPTFLDVGHIDTGERLYVSLMEAYEAIQAGTRNLVLHSEEEVKEIQEREHVVLLASRYFSRFFSSFTQTTDLVTTLRTDFVTSR